MVVCLLLSVVESGKAKLKQRSNIEPAPKAKSSGVKILQSKLKSTSAHGKNWLLRYLSHHKMEVRNRLDYFKNDLERKNHQCGNEWNTFGTYCFKLLTNEYLEKDRRMIKLGVRNATVNIYIIAEHITSLRDMAAALNNSGLIVNQFFRAIHNQYIKQAKLGFFELLRNITKGTVDFSNSSKNCWGKMSKLRKNSICYICSGRGHRFVSGKKAIIEDKTCLEISKSCNSEFKLLFNIVIGSLVFMKNIRHSLRNGGQSLEVVNKRLDNLIRALHSLKSSKMLNTIKKIESAETEDQKARPRAEFCEGLVSVVRRPSLRIFAPLLNDLSEDLGFLHQASRIVLFLKLRRKNLPSDQAKAIKKILAQDYLHQKTKYSSDYLAHRSYFAENFQKELNETRKEIEKVKEQAGEMQTHSSVQNPPQPSQPTSEQTSNESESKTKLSDPAANKTRRLQLDTNFNDSDLNTFALEVPKLKDVSLNSNLVFKPDVLVMQDPINSGLHFSTATIIPHSIADLQPIPMKINFD